MNRYYMPNFRCAPITNHPFIQYEPFGIHDPIRINRRPRIIGEFPPRNLYFVRAMPGTPIDLGAASVTREGRQWILFKVDTIEARHDVDCLGRFEAPNNLPTRGDWVFASINSRAIEGLAPIDMFERSPLSFLGEVKDRFIPQPAQRNAINELLRDRDLHPHLRALGLSSEADIRYLIHWTHNRDITVIPKSGRPFHKAQSCGYVNFNGRIYN